MTRSPSCPYEFTAAVLVGGQEKLRGGEEYGVPLVADVESAIAEPPPDVVVDLSDEPVLGPEERFALASRVLALGVPYVGADFRLRSARPRAVRAALDRGRRYRKASREDRGHGASRPAARGRAGRVVVVAMGRGGPPEPEVVTVPPTVEALVELSRSGRHAASDHLETAALFGVATVGLQALRRGPRRAPWRRRTSRRARAWRRSSSPDVVVFDGSGAALPPVAAERTVVVVGAHRIRLSLRAT